MIFEELFPICTKKRIETIKEKFYVDFGVFRFYQSKIMSLFRIVITKQWYVTLPRLFEVRQRVG